MLKKTGIVLMFVILAVGLAAYSDGAESDGEKIMPSAYLPASRYEFPPVVEGQEVTHDFVVQNKGSGILKIHRVKTD